MKKLLKVLLKLLNVIKDFVLAFMMLTMEICIVLVNRIDYMINVVADYILKKYEI